MRLKAFLFVVFYLLCAYSDSYAQLSEGGHPYSFNRQVSESIEVKELMEIDTEMLLFEDEYAPEFEPYRFGYGFDVSYNMQNSGTWVNFPDGSKLWRLKIISRGAYSINLIYDKFWLPEGSKYFLYNNEKSMIIGAFTSRNNKAHGKFATGLVKGDEIILEYYEPSNAIRTGEISISRVVHAYRDFFKGAKKSHFDKITGYGDSEACNNNVHCPEAEDWQNEVRSVGLIVLGDGTRLCSGSLLNNVKENYAPYFLTAEHCLVGDIGTWVIWFNYESNTCNNPPEEPTAQTLVGASHKASNIASDFALLILDETPPSDYNVYYNGWSNINTPPTSSVVIHHPSGDIKKISYEQDQAISSSWEGTPENSHWRVTFDDGTTERGSSGAPLINQDHRVVGQNHGGTGGVPFCEYRTKWYGKFSMSWNYGGSSSSRLRDWLDPDNTGATVLDGIDNGMLSEGTLPANATWSGSHTITGIIIVPSGVTLTISNSTNITLNGYSIISTGGTITIESGATINSSNSHTRLITGSAIKGIYSTIASAMSAATSGQSIEVYGARTLAANLTVPSGVTLTFKNGSDITLDSHTIQKGSGSLAIESGATFDCAACLKTGSTINTIYPSISQAMSAANSGQSIYVYGTHDVSNNLTVPSGITLSTKSGTQMNIASDKYIYVYGGFYGNNTTYTASSGTWNGIRYYSGSSGTIQYANISNASVGVYASYSNPVVSYTNISDCGTGVRPFHSNMTISNCTYGTCLRYFDAGIIEKLT